MPNQQEKQLDQRVDGLEKRLDAVEARLAASLDEVASETDDVGYAVDGLADRIRLLERRLRSGGAIAVVDLDHWPAGCTAVADAVRAGQEATPNVLDPERHAEWTVLVDRPDELRAAVRDQRAAALAAARSLTELDAADTEAWQRAVSDWNAAVAAGKQAEVELPAAEVAAGQARAELDAALTHDEQARPTVERGAAARTELVATIRARIGEAVRDDLLFPTWFETALGPGAPSTNTESWLDTAVDVVAYRLVNRVDDQVLALGQRPADEGWRRAEYDRLSGAFRGGRV